jgi:hypothetical protein
VRDRAFVLNTFDIAMLMGMAACPIKMMRLPVVRRRVGERVGVRVSE